MGIILYIFPHPTKIEKMNLVERLNYYNFSILIKKQRILYIFPHPTKNINILIPLKNKNREYYIFFLIQLKLKKYESSVTFKLLYFLNLNKTRQRILYFFFIQLKIYFSSSHENRKIMNLGKHLNYYHFLI